MIEDTMIAPFILGFLLAFAMFFTMSALASRLSPPEQPDADLRERVAVVLAEYKSAPYADMEPGNQAMYLEEADLVLAAIFGGGGA